MKKLLFVLMLFFISTVAYAAHREVYNVHTGRLDKVGVDNASQDVTINYCANGEILKYNGTIWACASDSTAAGGAGNDVIVSEDGVTIATSSTDNLKVNFTKGFEVIQNSVIDATVSMDLATTTIPGIASFDTSHFTVTPGGYVDLKVPSSDTYILYNDGNIISADAGFVWDNTTAQLGVGDGDFQGDIYTDGADMLITRNQNQPWLSLRGAWATADAAPLYDTFFSRGTLTSPSSLASGDDISYIALRGFDSNGWDDAVSIKAVVGDGAVSTVSVPAVFTIRVNDSDGSTSTGPFELSSSGSHDLFGKLDMLSASWPISDDDCTGEQGTYWYDSTDARWEFCNNNSGVPDTFGVGNGNDVIISTDSVHVASSSSDNLKVNFTTGMNVTGSGASAVASSDIASATVPGIASFDSTNFTVHPGGRVYIKDQGVTGDEIVNDTLDFTEFGDTMTLDANTTIATSNLELTFQCNNPGSGCFDFAGTGAYTGELVYIHQDTGNVGAGQLLKIEATDLDIDPVVHISHHAPDFTQDTTVFLIDAVDDDDANYIPFEIRDDEDANNDLLVRINYKGDIFTNSGVSADIVSVDSAIALWDSDNSHHTFIRGGNQAGDINYTLPTDDGDAGEQLQTDGSGVLTWEAAGGIGGATAYDDIGDPDAATSISFDDNETIVYSTAEDTGTFFQIDDTDAGLADMTYLFDLYWSGQDVDGVSNAIYLNMHDNYTTHYTFSGSQFSSYRPIVNYLQNGAGTGATWYTVSQNLDALDGADDYVKGYLVDWTNADHSAGNVYGFEADLNAQDAQAIEIAFKTTGGWDTAFDANDLAIINVGTLGQSGDAINSGSATSFEIPNANDVSGNTGEGLLSWDADNDRLYMGDGAAVNEIPKAGTLTDTKYCTWDNANAEIDCNSEGGASGGGPSNTDALVSFDKVFNVQTAKLPLVNPAQIDAGEPGWRLLYDADTPENASFDTVLTPYQGSSVSAEIYYTMTSATNNKLCFGLRVACVTPSDTEDIQGGWGYDTINSTDKTVPGTAGYLDVIGFPLTNFDSCTSQDMMLIEARRVADNAEDDTATGDAEIRKIRIYEV